MFDQSHPTHNLADHLALPHLASVMCGDSMGHWREGTEKPRQVKRPYGRRHQLLTVATGRAIGSRSN
jgi:hypothetical protein